MIRLLMVLILAMGLIVAACDDDDGGSEDDPSTLSDGESLGSIDRFPGGTQVPVDPRTFLEATCADGLLTIRTASETITADMDCEQMLPQENIDLFVDEPVAIRYESERLIVESPAVGTMNLPATEPHIEPSDAAS